MFLWVCVLFIPVHWTQNDVTDLPQIRYYSIALLIFDVTQIHLFTRPGITSETVYVHYLLMVLTFNDLFLSRCVAMDSIIRIVGAISLWSVEIIMQLRIYALFKSSKKVYIQTHHAQHLLTL